MLEGKALDQFMDRFFGDSCAQSLPGEEESGQELEEYELKEDGIIIQPIHKGKIEKRTWIGLIMFLAFVPLVLFILVHKFHGKHDVVISLLILAYATIPFFMVFEGRHPQAREIMVIAVMAALGVAGRSAFFMIGSFIYQKHCRGLTPSSMAASMISDSMDFIATIKIKIENPSVFHNTIIRNT